MTEFGLWTRIESVPGGQRTGHSHEPGRREPAGHPGANGRSLGRSGHPIRTGPDAVGPQPLDGGSHHPRRRLYPRLHIGAEAGHSRLRRETARRRVGRTQGTAQEAAGRGGCQAQEGRGGSR